MDQVTPNILTPGHNMFLSIDQEDEKATVTLDIQKTKYTIPGGGTGKIMYPLVSVANLMDPGKNMLIESAKEDSKYFMLGLNNRDIRSRLTWNYKEPKFTINHDNGATIIGAYYTDTARVTNNNRNTATKRGYAYIIKNNKGTKSTNFKTTADAIKFIKENHSNLEIYNTENPSQEDIDTFEKGLWGGLNIGNNIYTNQEILKR